MGEQLLKLNRLAIARSHHPAYVGSILLFAALLLLATAVFPAHPVARPITGGAIYQDYLWADEMIAGGRLFSHKGVDFPTGTGANVYAVASGTVVALDEHLADIEC